MFRSKIHILRDIYSSMYRDAEDIGMGRPVVYAGDFRHNHFPHFFQFETVYYPPENTFYTVVDHLPDGTYAILPTVEFDRGGTDIKYKAYYWSLEKLLD